MTPLQRIAMGLVLTIVDPIVAGYDAVPDVLGWALVLWGLRALADRAAVGMPTLLAVLAGAASVVLLRPDWLWEAPESTGWLLSLPQLAFSIVMCTTAADLVAEPLARRLRRLRWAFAAAGVGPVLLYGGGLDVLLVPLAVLTVLANVALVYLLFRAARELDRVTASRPRT